MIRTRLAAQWGFAAISLLTYASAQAQTTITEWNFNSLPSSAVGLNNTPAATTGSGTASALGMTNSYSYAGTTKLGSVNTDDILVGANNLDEWRVRGTNPNNGWNLAAPQYSQGAQFSESTVGYQNIDVNLNWFSTTQGVRDLQVQYTTDGTSWTNIGPLQIANSNGYATDNVNFGALGITSVDNDANFGVRFVSAYDPTLGTYASAASTATALTAYNNSSGNWRFEDVSVSGNVLAVPEPGAFSLALAGFGLFAAWGVRRKSDRT